MPLYPFFLDGVAADLELTQPDGMHPNAAGVGIIVERILPSVEELIAHAARASHRREGLRIVRVANVREAPHSAAVREFGRTSRSIEFVMPRLFTGLEIPPTVAQSLAMMRGGLPGARWIDPENYHLTLRFIGDIDDALAREIAGMLGRVQRGRSSFGSTGCRRSAAASRARWWPPPRRCRR